MARVITPREFGAPLGMYSHGMLAPGGELLVVAGQVGVGGDGKVVGAHVVSQTKQAFENVRAVLEVGGCRWRDVVRLQTFLTSADDIPGFMKARQEVFPGWFADGAYPPRCWSSAGLCARSCVWRSRPWPCARGPSRGASRPAGENRGASPSRRRRFP